MVVISAPLTHYLLWGFAEDYDVYINQNRDSADMAVFEPGFPFLLDAVPKSDDTPVDAELESTNNNDKATKRS
eukprot:UN08214